MENATMEEKKKYLELDMEVIIFDEEDLITCSGDTLPPVDPFG